jgi:hypothetical protein
MQITTIGLDIAKNVFQVHGIDTAEKVVIRKQLRRGQVLKFFASLPPCLVGIEACATARHWAHELTCPSICRAGMFLEGFANQVDMIPQTVQHARVGDRHSGVICLLLQAIKPRDHVAAVGAPMGVCHLSLQEPQLSVHSQDF